MPPSPPFSAIGDGAWAIPSHSNSRPADILVQGWVRGLPAAFDITVSSPLTPASLEEASASAGATARIAETRKHSANDSKCQELGWVCTPLAVESYGNWGMEAHSVFKCLASLIAIHQSCPKASVSQCQQNFIVTSTCF
eukprot:Em0007g1573a